MPGCLVVAPSTGMSHRLGGSGGELPALTIGEAALAAAAMQELVGADRWLAAETLRQLASRPGHATFVALLTGAGTTGRSTAAMRLLTALCGRNLGAAKAADTDRSGESSKLHQRRCLDVMTSMQNRSRGTRRRFASASAASRRSQRPFIMLSFVARSPRRRCCARRGCACSPTETGRDARPDSSPPLSPLRARPRSSRPQGPSPQARRGWPRRARTRSSSADPVHARARSRGMSKTPLPQTRIPLEPLLFRTEASAPGQPGAEASTVTSSGRSR
jgi:hypothetical protein